MNNGAAFVGLNFFEPSPRSTTLEDTVQLAAGVPQRVKITVVTVDPDDALLEGIFARSHQGAGPFIIARRYN